MGSLENRNKITRRNALFGGLATLAGLSGLKKLTEGGEEPAKMAKPESATLKLDAEQEKLVQSTVYRLPENESDKILFFGTRNKVLANNYREFVILQKFGPQYTRLKTSKEILDERNALLEDPRFKIEFLNNLSKEGGDLLNKFLYYSGFWFNDGSKTTNGSPEGKKFFQDTFGDNYPGHMDKGFMKMTDQERLAYVEHLYIWMRYDSSSSGISGFIRFETRSSKGPLKK